MRLEDPAWLREQAKRCRRLCATTTDTKTAETLRLMAHEYEQKATEMARSWPIAEPKPEPPVGG